MMASCCGDFVDIRNMYIAINVLFSSEQCCL